MVWPIGRPTGKPALCSFCAASRYGIPGPLIGLGLVVFRFVGREHVLQIDAGVLLVEIEARLARLDLTADRGRNAAPGALDLGEILGDRTDRAVLFDELADHVVERLKHTLMDLNVPVAMRHDVVAGAGLRFGGGGQLVLLALRGDVIDMDFDFVLLAPFGADLVERLVGARAPSGPSNRGSIYRRRRRLERKEQ